MKPERPGLPLFRTREPGHGPLHQLAVRSSYFLYGCDCGGRMPCSCCLSQRNVCYRLVPQTLKVGILFVFQPR